VLRCSLSQEEQRAAVFSDLVADREHVVWRDRSLALNFLFSLRRWKVSTRELFALVLENYHFAAAARVTNHLSRDLEQERARLRPLR
jgi:hypothetical protein